MNDASSETKVVYSCYSKHAGMKLIQGPYVLHTGEGPASMTLTRMER